MTRILVTGALGFIGSHFVKYTLDNMKDVNIVAVDMRNDHKAFKQLDNY